MDVIRKEIFGRLFFGGKKSDMDINRKVIFGIIEMAGKKFWREKIENTNQHQHRQKEDPKQLN